MSEPNFTFSATLKRINEPGGWWYVIVPSKIRSALQPLISRVYLKGVATIGKTSWSTPLMPFGKGVSMIAIKAEIRQVEQLSPGDQIRIQFTPQGL